MFFPKFCENYKPTDPRYSMNPKYKKHEENYIQVYQNQTIETRDEEKKFKSWMVT